MYVIFQETGLESNERKITAAHVHQPLIHFLMRCFYLKNYIKSRKCHTALFQTASVWFLRSSESLSAPVEAYVSLSLSVWIKTQWICFWFPLIRQHWLSLSQTPSPLVGSTRPLSHYAEWEGINCLLSICSVSIQYVWRLMSLFSMKLGCKPA